MFEGIRNWHRRRKYKEGKTLSRFVARDVRRDVIIVSAKRIDEGIIIGKVRTMDVLYLSKGIVSEPDFDQEKELKISELWCWSGQSWGGLPDRTSIVDHLRDEKS